MERLLDFRTAYARVVIARAGRPDDARLLRAFTTVERHQFLGAGPWIVREDGGTTADDDAALVYQDIGIGLAPGVPTGLPSLHAQLLAKADLASGAAVMHVGAGTGYYTAILAELVGSGGRVYAYEVDEALATRARANLAHWPWATVEPRSGVVVPPGPVDLVYVNAGVQQLPSAWLDALSPEGGVMFPLVPGYGEGAVFHVRRKADRYAADFVTRARFVPCIGTQDAAAQRRLADAFLTRDCERVRSLHLAPIAPDETSWFIGDGWWLSTAEVRAE